MSRIQGSRTFRLFVSSTFADFGAERDALQADVFPKLSALCAELGYRFQAIDLRWGIRTEAARDQATLDLCLKEVERCRALSPPPNFLLLLGDRYGWRPLPSRIDQCEYEELLALLTPDERSLVNWRRTESGEETGWYRLDENARPPSYVLLPRSATRLQSEPWPVVERRLWHAFQNAIAGSGWPESDDRRIKFEASATHQEVIKGLKSDGFAFIRTIDNFEDVSSSDFVDLDDEQRRDEAAMQRLRALQGEITHKLGSNVSTRHTIWSGSGLDDHDLESMCSDLVERLSRAIRAEVARIREIPREETERRAHREFASARRQLFCGRHHVLTALQSCLMSPDDVPVVIYGPMGAGKSALLAHVARLAEEMTPRTLVVYRSIGATPDSVDAVGLLKGVMQELDAGGSPEHRKNDYESLAKDCAWRLQYPLVRQVFILDALDQLPADSPARDFRWLPDKLLAKSNVIVSLSDHDLLQRLQTRAPRARIVEIGPLTDDEGAEMLRRRLEADGRALQPSQEAEVLEKFRDCRSPMFLALASEEARRWQSFDAAADNRIQRDIPSSIRAVIARFSEDREHGPLLVSRTLGYLSASRFGLSEDELADVLALDVDIRAEYEIHANQPIAGSIYRRSSGLVSFTTWPRSSPSVLSTASPFSASAIACSMTS